MTFLVSKTGIVYQKNLGRKTAEIASAYAVYNPDETWNPVSDARSTRSQPVRAAITASERRNPLRLDVHSSPIGPARAGAGQCRTAAGAASTAISPLLIDRV